MMKSVAVVNHTSHPHVMPNGECAICLKNPDEVWSNKSKMFNFSGDVINVGMSIVKGRLRHVVVKFPYTEKGKFN